MDDLHGKLEDLFPLGLTFDEQFEHFGSLDTNFDFELLDHEDILR